MKRQHFNFKSSHPNHFHFCKSSNQWTKQYPWMRKRQEQPPVFHTHKKKKKKRSKESRNLNLLCSRNSFRRNWTVFPSGEQHWRSSSASEWLWIELLSMFLTTSDTSNLVMMKDLPHQRVLSSIWATMELIGREQWAAAGFSYTSNTSAGP